jgi:two-component system, chemotaxis family, protein-glutamate methylesterase/glutaminase
MLIKPGSIRLLKGARENYARPAIDPLFRSAALHYGTRVVGVILTGTLSDGVAGLRHVNEHGGLTVVQDPREAMFPEMPENAIRSMKPDHVLPVTEIAALLQTLPRRELAGYKDVLEMEEKLDIIELNVDELQRRIKTGISSGISCPECGGGLWENVDGDTADFRCRVGHAYSREDLEASVSQKTEAALWRAVRLLEEKEEIDLRLASRMEELRNKSSAEHFKEQAARARDDARHIRKMLVFAKKNDRFGKTAAKEMAK